jgi:sugar lactone lactonase YvrE
VRRWKEGEGTIVAGRKGNQLNGVSVDRWGELYVADHGNARVMRWREREIVVNRHGHEEGSHQLSLPTGLSMDDEGNPYVADCWTHRIQKSDLILW